jgi:hypothetical protein
LESNWINVGAPSLSGVLTSPVISEQPPAAVALIGADGAIERATALFLDCCETPEALLEEYQGEIESVLSGEADHATAALDWTTLEIAGALAPEGARCALLTLARPAGDAAQARLAAEIDGSSAIAWLKDLDGRYLRVNTTYTKQLKTPGEEVCGKTDGELSPGQSIDGLRSRRGDPAANEPLEFEYTVEASAGHPAFAVLRFALRDAAGNPTAVCGVAAPFARANLARTECARLIRLERWGRSDEAAIRAEVMEEWRLVPADGSAEPRPLRPSPTDGSADGDVDQFAALTAELDAALETSARLDRELAEERRQVMVLREASVLAARRAQELLRNVTTERARSTELEESLSRAQAQATELARERDTERSRAERAEAGASDAVAHERQIAETLRAELAAAREELERIQVAASQAPTLDQLEAERAQTHEAKLAAEQAHAEVTTTTAALTKERRTVETLRGELRAAEEEIGRARRAASEAVAQAPSADELEQERRRADRANAALAATRARAEMAEAEAKSALAQARADLRRMHDEAAATAETLNAEKQRAASLRAELTELRAELERATRAVDERPRAEELAQERIRAEEAEAAAEQVRSEAARLAEKVAELEQTQAELAASSSASAAERRTAERLRRELAEVRNQLKAAKDELKVAKRTAAARPAPEDLEQERTRAEQAEAAAAQAEAAAQQAETTAEHAAAAVEQAEAGAKQARREASALRDKLAAVRDELERAKLAAVASGDPAPAPQELARERMRAEHAEDALHEQRTRAEQAAASAEEAQSEAAAAVAALAAERRSAEALRAELERLQLEAAAETDADSRESDAGVEPAPAGAVENGAPAWDPASQRALSAALTDIADWRTALKQAVNILGSEGKWDAVVALCPDERQRFLKCVAMWTADPGSASTFETRVWQHRQKLPAELETGGRWPFAKSLGELDTADDPLLKAAAAEGMDSGILVQISDGTQLIGMLQLLSSREVVASQELMLSLEGVGLQLVTIARLLNSTSAPQWRVGRL